MMCFLSSLRGGEQAETALWALYECVCLCVSWWVQTLAWVDQVRLLHVSKSLHACTHGVSCAAFPDFLCVSPLFPVKTSIITYLLSRKKGNESICWWTQRQGQCVCVCVYTGVGLEWLLEQIISAAISWTDRLMLHRLFYLSWAGIWIDWLLKLLLYFFFLQQKLWEARKRKPITGCQSLLSKQRYPPPSNNNNKNNHNHHRSPKTVEPLLFQFCTPKHSYTESTHTHTTSTVKMSSLTQPRLRSKWWRHGCQVVFLTSGPFLVCWVSLFHIAEFTAFKCYILFEKQWICMRVIN